jgi:hypothetical protein
VCRYTLIGTDVNVDVPDAIHRRIKMLAAIEGKTMKEEIIEMLGRAVFIDEDTQWAQYLVEATKEESESGE